MKKEFSKYISIIFVLSIFFTAFSMKGSTYALYASSNKGDANTITTGNVDLTFSEDTTLSLLNSLPISDEEAESTSPYHLTITNTGNLAYTFNLSLLNTTSSNQISNSYIKVKVDNETPFLLSTTSALKKNITLYPGKSISLDIRVWLDYNTPNSEMGKSFNAKITTIDGYASKPSFETDSWEMIANNTDSTAYNVGDTKCIALDGFTTTNDNGCDNGEFLVRIANKSTPNECSDENFSETACGFVVEFVDIITEYNMNPSTTENEYGTNVGSWPASAMYTYLNDSTTGATSIYNALPSDIKSVIINTKSVTGHGYSESTNFTSNSDKLYLLSPVEVYGANGEVTSYDSAYTSSRQLDYYQSAGVTTSNYAGVVKQYQGYDIKWWLRVPRSNRSHYFWSVNLSGDWGYYDARNTLGVVPAFRIG